MAAILDRRIQDICITTEIFAGQCCFTQKPNPDESCVPSCVHILSSPTLMLWLMVSPPPEMPSIDLPVPNIPASSLFFWEDFLSSPPRNSLSYLYALIDPRTSDGSCTFSLLFIVTLGTMPITCEGLRARLLNECMTFPLLHYKL